EWDDNCGSAELPVLPRRCLIDDLEILLLQSGLDVLDTCLPIGQQTHALGKKPLCHASPLVFRPDSEDCKVRFGYSWPNSANDQERLPVRFAARLRLEKA